MSVGDFSVSKGFETGFGTPAKAAAASVLAALGVKDAEKYATNAQTFLGNASAAILQRQFLNQNHNARLKIEGVENKIGYACPSL